MPHRTELGYEDADEFGMEPAILVELPAREPALDVPIRAAGNRPSIAAFSLAALLMFGPVAFGAVEDWSAFALQAGAAVAFLIWAATRIREKQLELARTPLYWPLGCFAALVIIQIAFRLSAYGYATRAELLKFAAYAAIFLLAGHCCRSRRDAHFLALLLAAFGFAVALFAILQGLSGSDKLYWIRKPQFYGWLYGPYVNRNHYAGLMEMLAPMALVGSLRPGADGTQRAWLGFAGLLMAASIFLSQSRGGVLAFALETLFLGSWVVVQRGRRAAFALAAMLLLLAALVLWLHGGQSLARFGQVDGDLRPAIARDSLHMFMRRPLAGWGLGSFQFIYPQYRSFYSAKLVDHAHNDYLELLVESGVLGFALAAWFLVLLCRRGAAAISDWERDPRAALSLAALAGCAGILLHSFFDFNLHIPANAALFAAWCAFAGKSSGDDAAVTVIRGHGNGRLG